MEGREYFSYRSLTIRTPQYDAALGCVRARVHLWELQGGFAERLKHVIEPAFTVDFTSGFRDFARTPSVGNDLADFVVSGSTKVTYGLTNRLFARGRTVDGVRGTTREIVTVGLQQTYYTNPLSAGFDTSYQSTSNRRAADVSPVALLTRVAPTAAIDTNYESVRRWARPRLQIVSAAGR